MRLIGLKKYRAGFTGFIEGRKHYVYFNYSKKRGYKKLIELNKESFEDHDHFISVMAKFVSMACFFKHPVQIHAMSLDELSKIDASNHI